MGLQTPKSIKIRQLIQVVIVILALVILVPQFAKFSASLSYIKGVSIDWYLAALLFSALSYLFATYTYQALSPKQLNFLRTLIIQVSCSFSNRLVPAGIGGMGSNGRYLRKSGYTVAQATALVGTNGVIGFASFLLTAIIVSIISGTALNELVHVHFPGWVFPLGALTILIVGLVIYDVQSWRHQVIKIVKQIFVVLRQLSQQPVQATSAVGLSALITLMYCLCLQACLIGVGVHITFLAVVLVYLGGSVANAIAPTPGGIGVVEAILITGFVAIGVDSAPATAAVLLYLIATFWLPIIPGYFAFRYAISQRII